MNQTLCVGNNCALLRSEEIANAHHDRDDHGGTKIQRYYRSLLARGGPRQLGIQRGFVARAYGLRMITTASRAATAPGIDTPVVRVVPSIVMG